MSQSGQSGKSAGPATAAVDCVTFVTRSGGHLLVIARLPRGSVHVRAIGR